MANSIRRVLAALLCAVMAVSVCGCGGKDSKSKVAGKDKSGYSETDPSKLVTEIVTEIEDESSEEPTAPDDVDSEKVEITFGTFNGEPIEWIVLHDAYERKLIISKYVLCDMAMDPDPNNGEWRNCSLRNWLNGEFLKNSFSSEEREKIKNIKTVYYEDGTTNSQIMFSSVDYVFLMIPGELEDYFSSEKEQIAYTRDGIPEKWWLGSAVNDQTFFVTEKGVWENSTDVLCSEKQGVRPMMYVENVQAGPIEQGTGVFSDSDAGRVLKVMYDATGMKYTEAKEMVEDHFGKKLKNLTVLAETLGNDKQTDNYCFYTQISDGTAKFNDISFVCNQDDGIVCRVYFDKTNSDFLPEAYESSDTYLKETEQFYNDLVEELNMACGTPVRDGANNDRTELWAEYNFNESCVIWIEFKNLDNGYIGMEIHFTNNAVRT